MRADDGSISNADTHNLNAGRSNPARVFFLRRPRAADARRFFYDLAPLFKNQGKAPVEAVLYFRPMTPQAVDNSESSPWRGIGRLLCAAFVLHLTLSVTLYEVGRRAVLPDAIDRNGIVVAVASDASDVRDDAEVLSGALGAGEVRGWLGADYPLHVKLYALCFALAGPWLGYNVVAAETLNAFLYLASLVAAFRIGHEVFDRRAGLLAAVAVALWPSLLLHSTQLLKDPLFVPAFLALVLILVRLLTSTCTWARALLTFAAGALVLTALWLTRRNWGWLLIAAVLIGALALALRAVRERRALAPNFVCAALLLATAFGVPFVMPNALKLGAVRAPGKTTRVVEADRAPATQESRDGYVWSRAAARVGDVRRALAGAFPDSGSDIDADVRISDASDLLSYLPRAAVIGFFAPFPNMWLTSGKQAGALGRRLAGLECLAMYAVEALALVGLWRGRERLSVWLLAAVATAGVTALGVVVVNVGALYRMRYGFLALLIIVAAGAAADLFGVTARRKIRDLLW